MLESAINFRNRFRASFVVIRAVLFIKLLHYHHALYTPKFSGFLVRAVHSGGLVPLLHNDEKNTNASPADDGGAVVEGESIFISLVSKNDKWQPDFVPRLVDAYERETNSG